MRIAVTGTHGSGKTTLIEDFTTAYPDHESVPEPLWLRTGPGMPFADGPTTADLEEQLVQSCALLLEPGGESNVIFDRCPLDFLAYLDVVGADEAYEWLPNGRLLSRIDRALASLDLLVFVPLLQPDEITVPIEFPRLRSRVDRRLRSMLRDDDLGLLRPRFPVLEVSGSRPQRMAQLAAACGLGKG